MKYLFYLLILIPNIVISQCVGNQSFTLNPLPTNNTYEPGTVVTMCYTMDGWNGTNFGSNWLEGFDINLGPGWVLYTPISEPINCSSNGTWIWEESVTNNSGTLTVGPGYFYEGPTGPVDGNTGNDWGDFGTTCQWTFCVQLQVSDDCDPQSLLIEVTPYADGTMGSWNNESCFDGSFMVFNGTVSGGNVNTSSIQYQMDTVCVNLQQNYSVVNTPGSTYNWIVNGGGTLNNNSQNFTQVDWTSVGDWVLSVQETTVDGCVGDTVSVDIRVDDYQIEFDSSYFLCPSGTVNLSATPPGGFWQGDNLFGSVFQATNPGVFYATYEMNKWGCLRKDSIDIRVRDYFDGFPISSLSKEVDMCVNFGPQIYWTDDSSNVFYTWHVDGLLQNSQGSLIEQVWMDSTMDHTIEVFATDTNGCRSDKTYLTVHVDACHRLYIPNTFTPNSDGINDAFHIDGINYYDPHLQIYNRWGDLIWEISSSNIYWNGNDGKGYYCDNGIYNWIIDYKDDKGFGHVEVGHVLLLR